MKKVFIYLLLLTGVIRGYAQELKTEIQTDSHLKKLEVSEDLNLDVPKLEWDEQVKNDPLKSLKFEGFSNRYTIHSADEKIYYSLYGNLTILPGLSTSQMAGGEINTQINKSFLVNFGAYGLKYDHNFNYRTYYDAIFHVDASYRILPWLIVSAYGQYSAFSKQNAERGSLLPSPMVPRSSYGVHAVTMFNEAFGIQGGVGKEFNPFNGRWESVYGVSPVINFNKLFK